MSGYNDVFIDQYDAGEFFFIGVIIRAMYRFFVKKKMPTVTFTPYDERREKGVNIAKWLKESRNIFDLITIY
ncbi:hypothetical protein AEA09_08375 [Lysinibacillus contaminans]|uniref:Uncharacterized protein n=1 Tax=Lysinibacillus contaminans TaxID=1293441 RepID=A0ABR5K1K2_9BACI|nr:hypothetical protein [Lysinibacillus contaminans]KOS68565.1 hypothetical protein AEA09_08375 [Lysinibacillus contaminans]